MDNQEIEVRFLDIDVAALKNKLRELGAKDFGEDLLEDIVFYDTANTWQAQQKSVRIRTNKQGTKVAYKHQHTNSANGTTEVEFEVDDADGIKNFLENLGFLYAKRQQQKKRHSYTLDDVAVDIDTWPKIPTFVELEGPSEEHLKQTAKKLGFDYSKADKTNAASVIESYGLPVKTFQYYTFDKIE